MSKSFTYSQFPHRYAGCDSDRQSVGDPGHCEACVSLGHEAAHPQLGCSDVGCYSSHEPGEHVDGTITRLRDEYGPVELPTRV